MKGPIMANTPVTNMRIDPELKEEASQVLEALGLNLTTAVTMFLKEVVRVQGLPLAMRLGKEEED
ncbi:type II toxin-antitoxin system RelB/DinJ family antitoxin [Eggerthella guodeyinii]|nr:type II toxin-antitoxin system RelB/DinJ family antitoxin [Eggerthella guodeyinii]